MSYNFSSLLEVDEKNICEVKVSHLLGIGLRLILGILFSIIIFAYIYNPQTLLLSIVISIGIGIIGFVIPLGTTGNNGMGNFIITNNKILEKVKFNPGYFLEVRLGDIKNINVTGSMIHIETGVISELRYSFFTKKIYKLTKKKYRDYKKNETHFYMNGVLNLTDVLSHLPKEKIRGYASSLGDTNYQSLDSQLKEIMQEEKDLKQLQDEMKNMEK